MRCMVPFFSHNEDRMPTKIKVLAALAAIVAFSGFLALAPARAEAATPDAGSTRRCSNSSCHGQGWCTYDLGWRCFLEPAGCAGNEICGGS